jgi:hypothetical protein
MENISLSTQITSSFCDSIFYLRIFFKFNNFEFAIWRESTLWSFTRVAIARMIQKGTTQCNVWTGTKQLTPWILKNDDVEKLLYVICSPSTFYIQLTASNKERKSHYDDTILHKNKHIICDIIRKMVTKMRQRTIINNE